MSLENRIALDTSRSIVVEACAGSGKTWLLSSRIARALLEGVPPRAILALTFTNKAAAEMRTRVIQHLQELAAFSDADLRKKLIEWGLEGDALAKATQNARGLLGRYLLDPQPPVISTFHSWYIRLAAMAPLSLAGMATRSLSQRSWDLMRQAWQLFYVEYADRVPYAGLVKSMGGAKTRQAMQDWVQSRVEWAAFAGRLSLAQMSAAQANAALIEAEEKNRANVEVFYTQQSARAETLAKAFAGCKGREFFCEMLAAWRPDHLAELKRYLLVEIDTDIQLASDQVPPARFRLKGGSHALIRKGTELARWGAEADRLTAEVHTLIEALLALLDANDARTVAARTQALWHCGRALGQCMDRVMAKSHEIDFTGLELTAWELMGGDLAPAFHERLDQSIAHVLVDEFQDTNPVQWGMLREWLSQYVQADDVLRREAPKVFLVGDPKQSIYRFRRADPQVFQVASQWLCEKYGATVLPTNTTRRCGPAVVAFLNAAMPALDASDRFQAHDTEAKDREGFVARLAIANDWSAEGESIARALWHVKTRHPEIPWSQMRILVRSRTHMAAYEQALAAGSIPFVSDRSGGLLNEPEVRDLVALLRFLAFPWSDVDCAHALKSPVFGFTDAQLASIAAVQLPLAEPVPAKAAPSFFDRLKFLAQTPAADAEIRLASQLLQQWIEWSAQLPVHDLLDRIVHRQDVFERMAGRFAQGRGLQCIANLEAFVALALDLDTGRLPSLARFLQELHRWSQASDAEAPGPGVMPSSDAVMLSTIHSAKGLEAEVVVLAGLLDRDRSDSGIRWLIDWTASRDCVQGVAAWQVGEPMFDTVKRALHDDTRQSIDEDFNLLYVGATRAKRILIFSAAQGGKNIDQTWFGKISPHCKELDLLPVTASSSATTAPTWRGLLFQKVGDGAIAAARAESLAIRQGKALHRLLEFGPGLPRQQILRFIAPFALPTSAQQLVIEAVQTMAKTDVAATIFDPRCLAYAEREWPTAEGAFIRPDRIVRISESPETWWIIDFKWQVLESELSDYAQQLASYQNEFQKIRPHAHVLAKILTAQAQVWQLEANRLVRAGP